MTVTEIKEKIATNDVWLERAVFAIWKYQTETEKVQETTNHFNGVGFNGVDGHIMTSFGNWINRRSNGGQNKTVFGAILSPKQKYIARKKMAKYAGQLYRISEAK